MPYQGFLKTDETDALFEAVLSLHNIDELYEFFEDIATIQEIKDFTLRLQVAKMLSEKKTYQEIVDVTKASATTIARVNKALQYGAGGYPKVLGRTKR